MVRDAIRMIKAYSCSPTMEGVVSMVGAAGFEPTTTRTPSECATRLRYAPTNTISTLSEWFERSRPNHLWNYAEYESIIRMIA